MSAFPESQPDPPAAISVTPLRRRPRRRKSVYTRPISTGRLVFTLLFVGALAAGAWWYSFITTARFAIELHGSPLVAVATADDAKSLLDDVKRQYAPDPSMVTFKEGEPEVTPIRHHATTTNRVDAVHMLDEHLTAVVDGYALYVNRTPMVLLPSQQQAWQAIELMQERGMRGKNGIPTFKERVTIVEHRQVEGDKDLLPVMTARKAAEFLVRPPLPQYATVGRGDSFWTIATRNGITVQDMKTLNPKVDYRELQPGDKLRLPDSPSPVTVVVRER